MVDHAHILVSYETHIDYRQIGERTARLLFRCIREGLKPVHYLRKLPLVLGRNGVVLEEKRRIEADDEEILTVSVLACNPWTDVDEFGPAVLLTATHEDGRFEAIRDELARHYWDARKHRGTPSIPRDKAIAAVVDNTAGQGPIVLQDCCDIIGGGGIGDDVTTLSELLGEGGAPPLQFDGTVKKLFDGDYELIGTPYGGLRSPLGATALVSDGDIDIIVTSKRIYPQPSALLAVMNVDRSAKQGIVVKDTCATSTLNPREVMNVDTPGLTIWDFAKVPYRKVQRPRFPMDDIAEPF